MKNKAFTLIELLVVILIVGILASIALSQYKKAVVKSRAAQLQAILSSLVKASNEYHFETGQYPTSFDQLDIDFNLPTIPRTQMACDTNWTARTIKKGDGFEITLNTGGAAEKYRLGVLFTEGRYKCTGFVHILRNDKDAPSEYDGNSYCAESYYRRACGNNCDNGDFCTKIMGMKQTGYANTVFLYK